MKEYEYSIIRRVSRNPKRNREGRGVSQSDLEALRQELAGDQHATVTTIRDGLELADTTAEDLRKRLETAEEELRKKLGSDAFEQWQAGDYAKALAGKQPAGNYVAPSDLAKSAKQAIAEAVKRAGEMDKEIKVGGRNLITRASLREATTDDGYGWVFELDESNSIWLSESRDYPQAKAGDTVTLSLLIRCDKSEWGASEWAIRVFDSQGSLKYLEPNKEVFGESYKHTWTFDLREGGKLPNVQLYNHIFRRDKDGNIKFNKRIEAKYIKLERGTVATDWTPAPEDVAESVSSLESKLLDPEQGEIHKLADIIGKHKEDTDKNFDDLANHPPTIDKDDLWQFWDVRKKKYVTTPYPSRGQKGKDAGRYLGRAKRIHTDLNGNYLLEKEDSWRTAKEGDYVYLVGDAPNRGGDKETFYIVREHKSKTVWEVYDIKGRKVSIEWHGTSLVIDNQPPVDLRGEAGHSPKLHVGEDDYLYIDGIKQRYIRGRQGEPGNNPNPEDVLATTRFAELLGTEVTKKVKPVEDELKTTKSMAETGCQMAEQSLRDLGATKEDLETAKTDIREAFARADIAEEAAYDAKNLASDVDGKLTTATTNITNLQAVALTTDQKRDLGYLTGSIRALMSSGSGTEQTLEGLMLQRFIGLSGNNKDISAYLASYPLDAVLKAGITDFGTANEREQVAINHNGTGHFGNLYFAGNQIDFRTSMDADPYLSIGAEDMVPIADFVKSARVDDTPISTSSVQLTTSSKVYERSVDVADDGTRLTITIDELLADCYDLDYAVLTLDGSNLASWQGDSKLRDDGQKISGGGGKVGFIRTPREWQNLAYERVVSKGRHTVRLELIAKSGQVTFTRFKVKRRYDTGRQQSLLTRSGLRLFGSPDRYLDVDYRKKHYRPRPGQDITDSYVPNPYTVRIVGGAKVDKLTADELDMPGVPLCGASFNESGGQIKAFGKYVNQRGTNRAQAVYDYGMNAYKVYHSIGHTNYIPMVQVSGWSSNNINWSLTPRVYEVSSYYFVVRILSNNDNPQTKAISYVAFKTE